MSEHICRLCGLAIRSGDDAVALGGEYFHTPCAEPALAGTPAWRHATIGALNQLAQGMGRATTVV